MPKTILLADDSVTIQKVVGISFANEDVVLLTVDNGDDAVARARESSPDIVLADIMMPGKNGYEVCEALKADRETQHVPVLLLSGTFESFDDDRARQVGADGHITKPFEAQALVDQVNELLARSAAAAAAPAAAREPEDATWVAPLRSEPSGGIDETYDFFDDEMPAMPAAAEPQLEADPRPAPAAAPPPTATGPDVVETEAVAEADDGENSIYDLEPLEEFASEPEAGLAALPGDSFGASLSGGMNWDTTGDIPVPDPTALAFDESEVGSADGSGNGLAGESSRAPERPAPPQVAPPETSETVVAPVSQPVPPAPAEALMPAREERDPFGDMDLPVGSQIYEPPDLLGDSLQPVPELEPSAGAAANLSESQGEEPVAHEPAPVTLREEESAAGLTPDEPALAEPEDSWARLQSTPPADSFAKAVPVAEAEPARDVSVPIEESIGHVAPTRAAEAEALAAEDSADESAEPATPQWGGGAEREEPVAATATPAAASSAPLSAELEKRLHDTIEKLAWDALGDLSEQMVKEAVSRIETVAWEVIPQMAETLIREEIERLKGDGD